MELQKNEDKIDVCANAAHIRERIDAACLRSGRNSSEVTLVAVSKTKPEEMVLKAYQGGTRDFGENYAQEMRTKAEDLPKDIRWHFIGHLQKNKVKYVVPHACMIHAVDSLPLAEEIEKEAAKRSIVMPILLEVNIAGEDTKFGLAADGVLPFASEMKNFPHLRLEGLMTSAPYVTDPEQNRVHFRNLRQLFIDIKSKNIDNVPMNALSMGMTGDFEVAVEEGATLVRVGTGIFGARDYGTR